MRVDFSEYQVELVLLALLQLLLQVATAVLVLTNRKDLTFELVEWDSHETVD